jgi:hypothetical protein
MGLSARPDSRGIVSADCYMVADGREPRNTLFLIPAISFILLGFVGEPCRNRTYNLMIKRGWQCNLADAEKCLNGRLARVSGRPSFSELF